MKTFNIKKSLTCYLFNHEFYNDLKLFTRQIFRAADVSLSLRHPKLARLPIPPHLQILKYET